LHFVVFSIQERVPMSASTTVISDTLEILNKDETEFRHRVEVGIRNLIEQTSRNDCVALIRRQDASTELEGIHIQSGKTAKSLTFFVAHNVIASRNTLSKTANPTIEQRQDKWVCEWQVRLFHSDAHVWTACFAKTVFNRGSEIPTLKGTEIDSTLSRPILGRVQEIWVDYVGERHNSISEAMYTSIITDPLMTSKLATHVTDSMRAAGKLATDEAAELCTQLLKKSLEATALSGGSAMIGKALTAILGKTLAHALAGAVKKMIAHKSLLVICKTILLAAIGKTTVMQAMIPLVKIGLAACGITITTSSILWQVVLPIVVAYAIHQIVEFPKKLAARVAPAVADAVTGAFRTSNKYLLENVYTRLAESTLGVLAQAIVDEPKVVEEILKLTVQ
jgi:hypothetical protein